MRAMGLKTGPFGIGMMIHAIHMTHDVPTLTAFYEEVFGGLCFLGVDEPHYAPQGDRLATCLMISNFCVEPMKPQEPVNAEMPVGKFYTKFGQHWHSLGYQVDDIVGFGNYLISKGVHVGKLSGDTEMVPGPPGTNTFFANPRDTGGLMAEISDWKVVTWDPRLLDTWSSQVKMWELGHPLGIKRVGYFTLGVRDADASAAKMADLYHAVPIGSGIDDIEGSKYHTVQLGDSLIRIAQPLDSATLLGEHVGTYGNMLYSTTFKVNDLSAAQEWLNKKGIRSVELSPTLVAAEPKDTYDAPYFFTTATIPNDPYDMQSVSSDAAIVASWI